jgi:outer membrane cobalamin receptor
VRYALAALLLTSGALAAQSTDTIPTLRAIVVAAEKAGTPINQSTAAVTRLTAADLARLPYASVADVLRQVPGFGVVDFDGSGRDPQLMVRGFYGGGETEYVQVMVDGRVVNQAHNGTIAWELLPPLASIESIEIVRGSSSTLHGDAAVAGVINIVTRRRSGAAAGNIGIESDGGVYGAFDITRTTSTGRPAILSAGADRTGGFRDHASRASVNLRGSMPLFRATTVTAQLSRKDFDEPGPLLESLSQDGSESDPRFRDDGGTNSLMEIRILHDGVLGAGGTLQSSGYIRRDQTSLTRTLPLTPDFADTKERELLSHSLGGATLATLTPTILPAGIERASAGLSLDYASIGSTYYADPGGSNRSQVASGDASRLGLAAFAHIVSTPNAVLRWTLGARIDLFRDVFIPGSTIDNVTASHFAFSPKAGVNIRYASSSQTDGRLWISASRTFKTPTLDQLFDQRPILVPFPPFTVSTSNAGLEPQRGTNVEAGVYHEWSGAASRVSTSLTLFSLEMRNELDFDVQSLKYINIGKSRHRGFEAGINVGAGMFSGHASATMQDVITRAGANIGKQLKAVPGQLVSLGLTISPPRVGAATVSVTRAADMFLDDANTRRIPDWTRVDAQVSRPFGSLSVILGARNLFDARINSTGFLDPSGSGEAYWYPAAGRVVSLGLRYGR